MENIKQLLDKSEIPDEVIQAIKYLDEYDLYTPYQDAWNKIKEYYQIDTDH